MTVVGYSTLEVIPSLKGLGRELEKQSGQFSSAGRKSGKQYGDAAGKEAGTRFKSGLNGSLKGFVAPFAGILAGAGIADFFRDSFAEAREAGQVARVTAKLIETTGQSAGLTAAQIGGLSERMMEYAAVDDELIQSGANVLLTFRNVRNEVGEGNQVFDRSVKAGLDLAAVLGTDLSGSALQLGKALNDPIKGMTALGRAGVQFTAEQKEQIKGFVEAGDLLSAQKAILTEVEKQVGGAAGAAADGTQRLSVAMGELKESFGKELMPAVTAFSSWAARDGVPAIAAAGGAAKDAAEAISSLPAPILAGAAAFGVLKIAAATGLGTAVASGVTSAGSALVGLRVRTMLARDAFVAVRAGAAATTGALAGTTAASGRAAAAMAALRAASVGAGTALKSGLSKASALVGGPWGAAFIAGTIILTKFWQNQQESKARVESLTSALDKQTGAVTKQAREIAFKNLQDSGAIDTAKELGISLELIREAALGNADALAKVNDELDRQGAAFRASAPPVKGAEDAVTRFDLKLSSLRDALGGSNSELDKARASIKNYAEFSGEANSATEQAADSFVNYRNEIAKTRTELQKLIDKEQKRTLAAIQSQRDELALVTTMQATRKEAREGARTLDINTKAGQENKAALLDLADQWANSTPKARAAIGGYEAMRKQFVAVADSMGITTQQANKLADQLLKVPKTAPLRFQSEGFKERMREIAILKAEAAKLREAFRIVYTNQAAGVRANLAIQGLAGGGQVFGRGTGTSDSNLIWASRGEFMQRKAAVDYYGVEFMRRLNNLQIPKYAQGGPITVEAAPMGPSAPLIDMRGATVVQPDPKAFLTYMQRRSRDAQGGGVPA